MRQKSCYFRKKITDKSHLGNKIKYSKRGHVARLFKYLFMLVTTLEFDNIPGSFCENEDIKKK